MRLRLRRRNRGRHRERRAGPGRASTRGHVWAGRRQRIPVLTGLKPGEKLIVSGIQKIGDGAPVQPTASPQARNLDPHAGSEAS